MKNKLIITIAIAAAVILSIGVGIIAFNRQATVMEKMKKVSEIETIENINENNTKSRSIANNQDIAKSEKAKEYMTKNQLIKADESDYKIQLVTNNVTNEKYYRLIGTGASIDIMKETGEVRRYINSNPANFIVGTTYNKEALEETAKKMMTDNELLQANKNYELIEVKEKTDFYPTAYFKDSANNKLMYMAFDPNTETIITIITKAIPVSENNETKIDENTAKNIAKDVAKLSEEDIVSVEQKEVVPNQMFLESGYYYTNTNVKRKAYVVKFNNRSKLEVYVDATTGEVIGGNGVW